MIDTREELVIALSEAAEVEHGLLVQYLFAAFSIERRDIPELSPSQQISIARWQKIILDVARQEMDHLAKVCNLLASIGGAPQFSRPNFPQDNASYFPLGTGTDRYKRYPFDFELEEFNDCSLYRFIISELPQGGDHPELPDPSCSDLSKVSSFSPDPIVYNNVGELYRLIELGFIILVGKFGEQNLFIGGTRNQDIKLGAVTNLDTAREIINAIIIEGENAENDNLESHYEKFVRVRGEFSAELKKSPGFKPTKNLVKNPQTRHNSDSQGNVTLILHPVTKKLAELFNDVYNTMLSTMIQYYSVAGETEGQREALKTISHGIMSTMLRPIAEILTEMPVTEEDNTKKAGPCFEIYKPIRLSSDVESRWIFLKERVEQEALLCESLLSSTTQFPCLRRLVNVYDNLQYTLLNLESVFDPQ